MSIYEVNLEELCFTQKFRPEQVTEVDLVFPRGAVPNAQLLWFRVKLNNDEQLFLTKSLQDFYKFVSLPESSIGGWTDGDRGQDSTGHLTRYALDDSGDGNETSGELQQRSEGATKAVAS